MTKEEAKHLSNIAKAYSEGKTIERTSICYGNQVWVSVDIKEAINLIMMGCNNVRIKPSIEYVPYSTVEEFFKDQKEHGPYIWLSDGVYNIPKSVITMRDKVICEFETPAYKSINSIDLLKYRWQDGTPCGIKTEVSCE